MNERPDVDDFERALLRSDRACASQVPTRAFENGGRSLGIVEEIVVPALVRIGAGWERGDVSLAQEYMSGRICQQLVAALPETSVATRVDQPRMAVGILADSHVLGKQIVVQVLQSAGYQVADWGARLSIDDVVAGVGREHIEVSFISTLMLRSALLVAQLQQRLAQAGLRPIMVVGGAPFRFDPQLGAEVGADFVGRSASDVLPILAEITAGAKGGTGG